MCALVPPSTRRSSPASAKTVGSPAPRTDSQQQQREEKKARINCESIFLEVSFGVVLPPVAPLSRPTMSVLNPLSDDEAPECPLCMEYLELDDISFYPCSCGYQVSQGPEGRTGPSEGTGASSGKRQRPLRAGLGSSEAIPGFQGMAEGFLRERAGPIASVSQEGQGALKQREKGR